MFLRIPIFLLVGWAAALLLWCWRLTCRYRVGENDPRPALREAGIPYVYALLHAHQLAALFVNDEKRMAAMVSRSSDGDLLSPSLTIRGVTPVRGSTRKHGKDKGGRAALEKLKDFAREKVAVLLAVDGPRGPRNHVSRGVADLAKDTGAAVVPVMVLPTSRWIIGRAWDRFQIPRPFSTVSLLFSAPITAQPGEEVDALRARIARSLDALELKHDPSEHPSARGIVVPATEALGGAEA